MGFFNFKVDNEKLRRKVEDACAEALEETATIAVGEIQSLTPVGDTGNLRRKITHGRVNRSKRSIKVGSRLSYAKYVEEGYTQKEGQYVPVLGKRLTGKHIDGRFMIHDGLTIASEQLEGIVQKKLKKKFKKRF